jgi:ATP-binding cassette subfamily B (MDR/TAP) protein 7
MTCSETRVSLPRCSPRQVFLVSCVRRGMFAFVARRSVRRPLSTASRIGAASPRQPALRAHSFPYLRSNIPALSVCRVFRHLAQNTEAPSTPTKVPVPPTEPRQATPVVTEQPISRADEHPTAVEQRRRDWAIIKQLVPHIWPKHDWGTKGRVLVGLGFLIAGKVCLSIGPVVSCARG